MRIGIIAPPHAVPPSGYGGTENVIDGLARGLANLGHDVTLAAVAGSGCPVPKITIHVGNPQPGLAREVPYVLDAYTALLARGVDVIHDHTQVGCLVGDSRGTPVITTNHNLFDRERRTIYREAARRGIGVVAISQDHAKSAGLPLAGVVHNGVDVASIPIGQGKGSRYHPGPYVCMLTRMSRTKGIVEAIRIAEAADLPLIIAAKMQTPAEHRYFDEQVYPALQAYPDARFISEVDSQGKYELLGGAVALLNPIQWAEPFGMAMIESLACGTPVLATLMGSAPEIIDRHTGRLRSHWSQMSADLANVASIDRAVCRQVAETRFGIDRMAAAYLELYADATAGKVAA